MRRVSSVAWKIVCQMDHVLFDPVPFENNLLKNNLFWIPKFWEKQKTHQFHDFGFVDVTMTPKTNYV